MNAGSIDVCVPDGVGLRIRTGKQALGVEQLRGPGPRPRPVTLWTRPDHRPRRRRVIELDTDANLGSITLNPEAGCG